METRTYADLLELTQALCGVDSFAVNEETRIRALINRRATKAYRATNFWPRFLVVGQERTVAASVIPYGQSGLSSIDTFLRVHATSPFVSSSAQEYAFHIGGAGANLVAGGTPPTTAFVTYKAVHNTIYGNTSTTSNAVPKEWFDYLAHAAYSDFLRAEGQQEKAVIADAEATDILTDELFRVDEQLPSFLAGRTTTYANMQTRNTY